MDLMSREIGGVWGELGDYDMKKQPEHSIQQKIDQVLSFADQVPKSEGRPLLSHLIGEASANGVELAWSDIYPLAQRVGASYPPRLPNNVIELITTYFQDKGYQSALDPCANTGTLIAALIDKGVVQHGTAITTGPADSEILEAIVDPERLTIIRDPFILEEKNELGVYDLVISLPFEHPGLQDAKINVDGKTIKIEDDNVNLIVLLACLHLADEGEALFILPESFFNQKSKSVYTNLEKFGLYVNAVVALPKGVLAPWTSIDFNLVLISHFQTIQLFVARLDTAKGFKPLLDRMRENKLQEGKRIRETGGLYFAEDIQQYTYIDMPWEIGWFVERDKFRSIRRLELDEEIAMWGEASGALPIKISEVAEKIILGRGIEGGGFQDQSNSVYLPLVGNSPAVTNIPDFEIKPQNYAQLVLREEKALAEYIAGLLNTEIGGKIRDQLSTVGNIAKISKANLREGVIYLPPFEKQLDVTRMDRIISEYLDQLEGYKKSIWDRPRELPKVRKALEVYNRAERFEDWLETLPFPLASILWRFQADADVRSKNEHLLHFFEATAQFVTGIMLSAYRSNEDFYKEHKRKWIGTDSQDTRVYRRSTFGNWVILGERLAKFTRRMLSGKERDRCMGLFRVHKPDLLDAIAGKPLFATLNQTNRYRNNWIGHGGIASDRERARRLGLLEQELSKLRQAMGDCFRELLILRPRKSEYKGGIHKYVVESLMGAMTIFREVNVLTTTLMDSEKLYLLDTSMNLPLELLPLFRMFSGPDSEKNACYFYNRIERDSVRWVSYHFEQESERMVQDQDLLNLIFYDLES